jgi:SAM-dependent methyltransferase
MPDRFFPSQGTTFPVVRCRSCGVVFTATGGLSPAYPPDYEAFVRPRERVKGRKPMRDRILRAFYEGRGLLPERILLFLPFLIFRFRDWYRIRNKRTYDEAFHRGGRILDVGCGRGLHLLRWMNYHESGTGVELHEPTAKAAKTDTGLDIRPGTLEGQGFLSESFDDIAFCHVLEHVEAPRKTLIEACRVLKKDGELLIWSPNYDSLLRHVFGRDWMPYEIPRHLWHFTPSRINTLLRECGFSPTEIAMDSNEYAFRRSVNLLHESGRTTLARILKHRWVRILLGLVTLLLRRSDVFRIRAVKTGTRPAP